MTTDHVPVDDPEVLRRILATTDALLLDFDGPVCAIFANLPAQHVADQLRRLLAEGGHIEMPAEVEKTEDPFNVLTYAATLGAEEARCIEASLRAHEVEAATTAPSTLGAHDLIHAWRTTGRKLAIVSNNSRAAVDLYLRRHDLSDYVDFISARDQGNFRSLKPNPHLVLQAVAALQADARHCTLIGDSLTDVEAAQLAGVASVAFANKAKKLTAFLPSAAQAVVSGLDVILETID